MGLLLGIMQGIIFFTQCYEHKGTVGPASGNAHNLSLLSVNASRALLISVTLCCTTRLFLTVTKVNVSGE